MVRIVVVGCMAGSSGDEPSNTRIWTDFDEARAAPTALCQFGDQKYTA